MTSQGEEEEEDGPTTDDDEGTDCGGAKGKYLRGRKKKEGIVTSVTWFGLAVPAGAATIQVVKTQ